MKLNTAIAIAVAAAFAVPFAAQASAEADRIIVAQAGSTTQPKDSNPAAPPRTFGPGKTDSASDAPKAEKDRPASGAASGSTTAPSTTTTAPAGATGAPVTSGTNAADRKPNTPKAEAGATSRGGFSAMDKNNDGYISRDEAKDATWSNRFTELDKDNDGRLSQSEFNAMQAGAGATVAPGATSSGGAPLTSGTNAPDRKPSTPKQ
ncbi:MAG TPA: EF-hand domain-containing protein [Burkholderiales bacterium]|nr:EF-hand domain-containing protein [Burkholderiales bacterium]